MIRLRLIVFASFVVFWALGTALGNDPAAPKKTGDLVNMGKALYEKNCMPCHGPKGDGNSPIAATLTPRPANFTLPLKDWDDTKGDPEKIFGVISKGIAGSAMAGWPQLSEKERWALVYFVMEFSTEKK